MSPLYFSQGERAPTGHSSPRYHTSGHETFPHLFGSAPYRPASPARAGDGRKESRIPGSAQERSSAGGHCQLANFSYVPSCRQASCVTCEQKVDAGALVHHPSGGGSPGPACPLDDWQSMGILQILSEDVQVNWCSGRQRMPGHCARKLDELPCISARVSGHKQRDRRSQCKNRPSLCFLPGSGSKRASYAARQRFLQHPGSDEHDGCPLLGEDAAQARFSRS